MLLGISKQGDGYLRCLLIQGARAVITRSKNKTGRLYSWLAELAKRKGIHKACVALANKNARIIWALLVKGSQYHAI